MAQDKKAKKKFSASKRREFESKPKKSEYFLMLEQKTDASKIVTSLREKEYTGLDLWESMGVFAIETKQDSTVDFEEISVEETFTDPSDHAFIKNRNIQSVYSFEATDEEVAKLKAYFKEMIAIFGGFVCSDSEDFQPMLAL